MYKLNQCTGYSHAGAAEMLFEGLTTLIFSQNSDQAGDEAQQERASQTGQDGRTLLEEKEASLFKDAAHPGTLFYYMRYQWYCLYAAMTLRLAAPAALVVDGSGHPPPYKVEDEGGKVELYYWLDYTDS